MHAGTATMPIKKQVTNKANGQHHQGMPEPCTPLLVMAFLLQYLGLLAERWFFFAQANHPQNLYYQTIS